MKTLLSLGAVSLLLACSSGTTTTIPGPAPTDTGTPAPAAQSPNGAAYPTNNLGFTKDARIPNLKFVGYKAADTTTMVAASGPTTTMSLADFYNPDGSKPYTIIHLSAAAGWCGPCNAETSEVSGYDYTTGMRTGPGVAADLAPKGVVFLQALVDGYTEGAGIAPTSSDLHTWITAHQNNFSTVVDPEQVQLGPFFQGASIPWNADIDARSMQILDLMQGYSQTLEADISTWVDWTKTHPAMQ